MYRCGFGVLLAFLLSGSPARGAQTPFPDFTGERVVVAGVPDGYGKLRERIADMERDSRETYYVVVVESTGSGEEATRNYADGLYSEWLVQSKKKGIVFDPAHSMLLVLGVGNRQLAVHPGSAHEKKGLKGQRIHNELVAPHFIPHAKAGRLDQGLIQLVEAAEARLTRGSRVKSPQQMAPPPPVAVSKVRAEARKEAARVGVSGGREEGGVKEWLHEKRRWLVGIFFAIFVAIIAPFRGRKSRKASKAARERFQVYSKRVVDLLDRMDGLAKRHQYLPYSDPDYAEPMTGTTLERYESVDHRLDSTRRDWLNLMDVHEKIEEILESERRLRGPKLQAVTDLLDSATGIDEIDASCDTAEEDLEQLEQAHEDAAPLLNDIETSFLEIESRMAAVREAELPTAPYDPEIEACIAVTEQEKRALVADPFGARKALGEMRRRLQELSGWLEKILYHVDGVHEVDERFEAVRVRVDELRSSTWKLTEEEANPDPHLVQARRAREATWRALSRGEDESAADHLQACFEAVNRASLRVEDHVRAKEFCIAALEEVSHEAEETPARLEQGQHAADELRREHAPEAWQDLAGNLDQARKILDTLQPLKEQAEGAMQEEVQRYGQARELLTHIRQQQAYARDLVEMGGERLEELRKTRDLARTLLETIKTERESVRDYLREHEKQVNSSLAELLESAGTTLNEAAREMQGEQPHWPALEQQLEDIQVSIEDTRAQAEEDVAAYNKVQDQLRHLLKEDNRIGQFLELHRDDRPRANQMYQAAHTARTQLEKKARSADGDWESLVIEAEGLTRDLETSERLAKEDINLAREARTLITQAQREIQRADSFHRHGISANVSQAKSQLEQSRVHIKRQLYEDAIELAKDSEQVARSAYEAAVQRARERRREINRRRLHNAARLAHTAAYVFGNMQRAGAFRHRPSMGSSIRRMPSIPAPRWSPPSSTSSSSWGRSSTSSSSW